MSIRIDTIVNQRGARAVLLRKSWREGGKVRHKTLGNLSKLPPRLVDGFRAVLRGGAVVERIEDAFAIERSLPHGHAAATLAALRGLGLERILHRRKGRERDLAAAAVVARIIDPASRPATARALDPEGATSSLGDLLGLGPVSGNEMLAMLDWLRGRQPWIERSLANRHPGDGTLVILYDVSSSYFEGRCCPLAALGHSRDGRKGKMQTAFGLLCAADGCPVAAEVFAGNASDPETVASQVRKIRSRFAVSRVALVGDWGMLTSARLREDLEPADLHWISALRTADIRKLPEPPPGGGEAPLDPERLPPDAVAEIASPDFPGERLMACLNPRLREDRARKREELLSKTEEILREIAGAAARGKPGPANRDRALKALGRRASRKKVEKYFDIEVREDGVEWARSPRRIADEARLDGIYVVRTCLGGEAAGRDKAVERYESLAAVERAFRTVKASRLEVRPIFACGEERVRAHVFLCMLACYVEWHMRRKLAPLLFEDDDRAGARAGRASPVEKAEVSESSKAKAWTRRTAGGLPAHSMDTLLADLATLTLNTVSLPGQPDSSFRTAARPTEIQKEAFRLLGIEADRDVCIQMTG